jgi:hypothetical protein
VNAPARSPIALLPIEVGDLVETIAERVVERLATQANAGKSAPLAVNGTELCRLISVSRTTLHRLRVEGMPAIPVGDTFRYEPVACLNWLRNRNSTP